MMMNVLKRVSIFYYNYNLNNILTIIVQFIIDWNFKFILKQLFYYIYYISYFLTFLNADQSIQNHFNESKTNTTLIDNSSMMF